MISPRSLAQLKRWWEVAAVLVVAALGAYWVGLGGFIFLPLGLMIMGLAIPMGITAYRRQRFVQGIGAAGVIEVVEGELRFFAPDSGMMGGGMGGFITLRDLVELRLVHLDHHRYWRLKAQDGQALMVPVNAVGHDALFDVFATLPHINTAALLAALDTPHATGSATQTLWRRDHT